MTHWPWMAGRSARLTMAMTLACSMLGLASSPASALPREEVVGRAWTRAYYVHDLTSAFLVFWKETAALPMAKRLEVFRDRFEPMHQKVLNAWLFRQVSRQEFYQRLLPETLQQLEQNPELAAEYQRRALVIKAALPRLANRLQTTFEPGELRLDRPYVLGLDFGLGRNGVGSFEDQNVLVLNVERFGPEVLTELELAGQLYRLLHEDVRARRGERLLGGLGYTAFDEGSARLFASEHVPGYTDREVLGYTPEQWSLSMVAQADMTNALRWNFESTDPGVIKKYASDTTGSRLVPPRTTDFVGYRAVQFLRRYHAWDEIIRWDARTIQDQMYRAMRRG